MSRGVRTARVDSGREQRVLAIITKHAEHSRSQVGRSPRVTSRPFLRPRKTERAPGLPPGALNSVLGVVVRWSTALYDPDRLVRW